MKILFLTRYGVMGASSRMRSYQFIAQFKDAGIECVFMPLLSDDLLAARYATGSYGIVKLIKAYAMRMFSLINKKKFDLIWIEKEAFPWLPSWFETYLLIGRPYILDFDDAIFHNYDMHSSKYIRKWFGSRIDRIMKKSVLVVAGNTYLANRARIAGAAAIEFIPTVVDLERYTVKKYTNQVVSLTQSIVWIGSPSTVRYLQLIAKPLSLLALQYDFKLIVIGGAISLPNVNVECRPWSADTEAEAIQGADIGVMPLENTPWEQGKCAYKLIQYMACGLPTVSSAIGANLDVVKHRETGFCAQTTEEWVKYLGMLLEDRDLRHRLGIAGRLRVESDYSLQKIAPKLIYLLKKFSN